MTVVRRRRTTNHTGGLSYGADSTDNLGFVVGRSNTLMAAQQELGLWAERRTGTGPVDCFDSSSVACVLSSDTRSLMT